MNHNQDLAFNSLKIISNQDSYSKNSGCLILNGGLGCKKTIYAECINVKNLYAENFNVNKFNGIVNFENIVCSNIDSFSSSINILNSNVINFEYILPSSEVSKIGNSENKISYINSLNLESDNIICNLESFFKESNIETCTVKYLKYENIISLDNNSLIGNSDNRIPLIYVEKINSKSINSDEGNYTNLVANYANIDKIKTLEINSNNLKIVESNINNLTCLESSIDLCKVDLLLPKNNDSSIGDNENRINIFSETLDSDIIKSLEINADKINVQNIDAKKVTSDSINTKNLEIENINVKDINSDNLTSSNINVQKLIPMSYNSKIGSTDNRFEIFSSNLMSINLDSSNIFSNLIESAGNIKLTLTNNGDHIINTFKDESKCEIKCDLFVINASKDKLSVSDDGIEFDNLNIKKYHLIKNENINEIYPIKSTIIIDLKCTKVFKLQKVRSIEDSYHVKEGTSIEIINFGNEDIYIENIKITQCEKVEFIFYSDEWRSTKNNFILQGVGNMREYNMIDRNVEGVNNLCLGNIFNNDD